MIEWDFEPYFGNYYAVALLGLACLLAIYAIRLDRSLSFGKRCVLTGTRFLIMASLLLIMLRPGVTFTSQQASKQSVAVMVDTSASMQLPSGISTRSRWEIEQQCLKDLQRQSLALGENIAWQIYAYDQKLTNLAGSASNESGVAIEWTDRLPQTPTGVNTDIGQPLFQMISAATDPPLLAVIWLGDGTQTTRNDPSESQEATRQLTQLDVPLYFIGVGPRSEAEHTRDQIVEGIPDQVEAFTKNLVPLRGSLRAIGLPNRELKIEAMIQNERGELKRLEQTTVKADQLDQTLPFQMMIRAPEIGTYQIKVRAEGVDGEATLLNNEQTCFLNVRDTGSRVLILEGQARPEQKFIGRALADSPDLQLDFPPGRWIPEANRAHWPVDLSEVFKEDLFDCMVLGDLDAEALGDKNLQRMVELVHNGTGLILLGGYHAYASGGYQDSPLASILPVELDDTARQLFGQPLNPRGHWLDDIQLEPRGDHPILRLDSVAAEDTRSSATLETSGNSTNSASTWKSLRPLQGANRWKGIRPGPGVQILATGPKNEPLIVSGEHGKGRILCIAFDTSYRWWLQGQSIPHRQFWRQAILWTMRREQTEEGLRLTMPRRSLSLGESTPYKLTWSPGSKGTILPKDLEVRWSIDGVDRGPLVPQRSNPLEAAGELVHIAKPGQYAITARATNSEGKVVEAKLPFIVLDMAVEKLQSAPDWQLIHQLAKLNEAAGGRVLAPEETDEIIRSLKERRLSSQVASIKTIRLGDSSLDSWITFLFITGLMVLQWSLRKAWNLP